MKYVRNCPDCDIEIEYSSKYSLNYSERDNKKCRSCSSKIRSAGIGNSRFVDITGQTFNSLTAIRPTITKLSESGNSSGFYWEFECACGKIVEKAASPVKMGHLKSCGCESYKNTLGNSHGLWKGVGEISKSHFNQIEAGAKNRKNEKQIDFEITMDYIWNVFLTQNKKCALTGIDIYFGQYNTKHGEPATASLDRINNNFGYVEGNVQWVHKNINKMKQDFSMNEFTSLCKMVAEYNKY